MFATPRTCHDLKIALVCGAWATLLAGCNQAYDAEPAVPGDDPAAQRQGTAAATKQAAAGQQSGGLPEGFPKPVISGKIPVEVPLPPNPPSDPLRSRPFFDYFSWQSFIALNWPASDRGRGVADQPDNPDVFMKAPNGTPTVWGTYKEAFELFGQGDQRPSVWDSHKVAVKPCEGVYGPKVFLQANKGTNLLEGLNEAFSFPLIDQQRNYAYTEVRFDKAQYNFIRGEDDDEATWLYKAVNLVKAQPLSMPASSADKLGALMIKGTWKVMTPADDPSRYYVVDSQLYDPETQECRPAKMGLVGLHVVQKTAVFPEWIWSSFEQVDNVERGPGLPADKAPSFNNGKDEPKTIGGWANRPPAKIPPLQPRDQRVPVQVTRLNPIPDVPKGASTQDLNTIYQELLAGTVWQHYQLIVTQWPTKPTQFKTVEDGGLYPQDSGQPFPVSGCTNTVMETFFQSAQDAAGAGGNSCMSCHYLAGKSDYSWALQLRAH